MAQRGDLIDGKYEILKQIGKGGMSKVYLSMDIRLNKQWAIKEIDKHSTHKNHDIMMESLIKEANLMKRLDHPAFPRIVDIIDTSNMIYVIMDYMEGETLAQRLKRQGPQPQDLVIAWGKQICAALDYLHHRDIPIVYRDMKPGNLMLSPDGNIKVFDFGIARERSEENFANDNVGLGTPGYAAPEQKQGLDQTDQRSDIYTIGCTLYHLLTGALPSEDAEHRKLLRDFDASLSSGLEKVVMKCLNEQPEDRYHDCAELLYALEHYEEYDGIYITMQKRKLHHFYMICAISLFGFVLGIGAQLAKHQYLSSTYQALLTQAEKTSDEAEAISFYQEAIQTMPNSIEGYTKLLNRMKDDAVFTLEEEATFKQLINTSLETLKQEDGYIEFAFSVGKLYWYYYDYGKSNSSDNTLTRMKSSIQWFDDVITLADASYENYQMSQIYAEIGKFHRDITLAIEEADDQGMYITYFQNIEKLLQDPSLSNETELVKLELYELASSSLLSYARKFKEDGVSQEAMETLAEQVKQGVEDVMPQTDKTIQMKADIQAHLHTVSAAIQSAFRKDKEEQRNGSR